MQRTFLTLTLVMTFIPSFQKAMASEIDSFTQRYDTLNELDAANPSPVEVLDIITNKKFAKAIEEANGMDESQKISCNVKNLYDSIKKYLAGPKLFDVEAYYGVMDGVVDKGESSESEHPLVRKVVPRNQSVYQNFTMVEAPAIYYHISSTFAVNHPKYGKFVVGADKLGHFFGQGFSYHVLAKDKDLTHARKWGERSEKGHMGLTTTGVYSYGDLAANDEGRKFWDRMIEAQGDHQPYVLCKDGHWTMNPEVKFSWMEYLNPGMDEGVNCSYYRTHVMRDKVFSKQLLLQEQDPEKDYTCPVDVKMCKSVIDYYNDQSLLPENKDFDLVNHMVSEECQEEAKNYQTQLQGSSKPKKEEVEARLCKYTYKDTFHNFCSHMKNLGKHFLFKPSLSGAEDEIISTYQKAIGESFKK